MTDFAYIPQWMFTRRLVGEHLPPDPREPENDHYWRTIPIRTISYIDRYDLPLEIHFARAREIVALGDRRFLPELADYPWICAMRLAQHFWPEA